jgi:hypothetical protein
VKRSIIASAIALFVYVVIDPELVEGEEPLYFALAVVCFLSPKEKWPIAPKKKKYPKTPAKSLVKPQNHSTHFRSTTCPWHFSYVQFAILDI